MGVGNGGWGKMPGTPNVGKLEEHLNIHVLESAFLEASSTDQRSPLGSKGVFSPSFDGVPSRATEGLESMGKIYEYAERIRVPCKGALCGPGRIPGSHIPLNPGQLWGAESPPPCKSPRRAAHPHLHCRWEVLARLVAPSELDWWQSPVHSPHSFPLPLSHGLQAASQRQERGRRSPFWAPGATWALHPLMLPCKAKPPQSPALPSTFPFLPRFKNNWWVGRKTT